MAKKWIAINLLLIGIAGLLAWQLRRSVVRFHEENDLAKLQPVRDIKQKLALSRGLPPQQPRRRYNAADFGIIPAQNLFSELRTNEKVEVAEVEQQIPELRPKPILVGVTLAGNQRLASIIEPPGAGNVINAANPLVAGRRRTQTKSLGDVYQGYTITDITENQMVLEYGPRREVIPLFDGTKQQVQPGKTPVIATRVINFGPAGAPGTPVVPVISRVSSSGAAGARRRGAHPGSPVASAIDGPTQPPQGVPGQSGIQRQPVQVGESAPVNLANIQQRPPLNWNERIDEQGRQIIRTPFGDIVRDKP